MFFYKNYTLYNIVIGCTVYGSEASLRILRCKIEVYTQNIIYGYTAGLNYTIKYKSDHRKYNKYLLGNWFSRFFLLI